MGFESKKGQPPLYSTPDELIGDIANYVTECEGSGRPITICGFVHYSRFESRQSLVDYERYWGFSDTIKKLKLLVEADLNERLLSGDTNKVHGIMFLLRANHGWRDEAK